MPAWPLPPGKPAIYLSTPGGQSAPVLDDWQASYNGVTFGAGTPIGVLKFHGLGGLPTVGAHDVALPRDTGELVGVDAMGGRDPGADLVITANIFAQMVALGGALNAGGGLEQPLWFALPGLPTLCSMARPRTRADEWDSNVAAAGMWTPTVTWHATDPRLYDQASTAYTAASSSSSVGLTVTNAGNCETRPVLILNGPLAAPSIQFGSATPPIVISFAPGTSIAGGDTVVIDCSTPHTVTYWTGGLPGGSAADAYNMLDQAATSWPTLAPGATTLTCTASQATIDPDCFGVWWADAYML
ncbi:MAG: hypothetical protein ABSB73_11905 [Solirubrobacteraceae bacterium]|jgi:hypothetical protein